ncbi:MAG: hypothetical protein HDS10_08440 [Bacteroides sp.]|nr:hypothetical protein [Bacteroides sp.]
MTKQLILPIALMFSACAFAEGSPAPKNYIYVRKNAPAKTTQIDSVKNMEAKAGSDSIGIKPASNSNFSFAGVRDWCRKNGVADNLSVSFTLGSGGLGLEVSTPLTSRARLRTGVEWVPTFTIPMNFELSSFSGEGASNDVSHIQEMVKDLMGLDMDDKVTMDAKPNMLNYKLLVDVFPFRNNRHWYVSAGFYIGSPVIGRAKNNRSEMQTLVGVNIYNRAYRYFTSPEFDPYMVAIGNGTYLDPELAMEYRDKFERYGSVGIQIGNFKDGSPYMMEPTKDGKVTAKATTNNFRPYLGVGYNGAVDKKGKLELGFDAGVLFWGGVPNVITHDGVNMTKDLEDIRGKVGDYMSFMKALPVFPILNFKITYTIF